MSLEFTVDASNFYQWAFKSIQRVHKMRQSFDRIIPIAEVHIRPWIPLERGYLENSMKEKPIGEYPFMEVELSWSGEENPYADGFDYARYQHDRELNHPRRPFGRIASRFVVRGMNSAFPNMMVVIETDYLSALGVH